MSYIIVTDSSANLRSLDAPVAFGSVPLKIITSEREFVDAASLRLPAPASQIGSAPSVRRMQSSPLLSRAPLRAATTPHGLPERTMRRRIRTAGSIWSTRSRPAAR